TSPLPDSMTSARTALNPALQDARTSSRTVVNPAVRDAPRPTGGTGAVPTSRNLGRRAAAIAPVLVALAAATVLVGPPFAQPEAPLPVQKPTPVVAQPTVPTASVDPVMPPPRTLSISRLPSDDPAAPRGDTTDRFTPSEPVRLLVTTSRDA